MRMNSWSFVAHIILWWGGLGRVKAVTLESLAYFYFNQKNLAFFFSVLLTAKLVI